MFCIESVLCCKEGSEHIVSLPNNNMSGSDAVPGSLGGLAGGINGNGSLTAGTRNIYYDPIVKTMKP